MPRRTTRSTTDSTRVVVLPVRGPASTSGGPPACSTTRRCASSRRGGAAAGPGRRTSRDAGGHGVSILSCLSGERADRPRYCALRGGARLPALAPALRLLPRRAVTSPPPRCLLRPVPSHGRLFVPGQQGSV